MEMTSDLETFEKESKNFSKFSTIESMYDEDLEGLHSITRPKASDLSTLRTLIAAWLHTGLVYQILHVFLHFHDSILYPFYHKDAFIRKKENISGFLQQLRALHNVDIMVDTLTILSYPPLDLYQIEDQAMKSSTFSEIVSNNVTLTNHEFQGKVVDAGPLKHSGLETPSKTKKQEHRRNGLNVGNTIKANFESNRKLLSRLVRPIVMRNGVSPALKPMQSPKMGLITTPITNQHVPPYLVFHANEPLAFSLRSERNERRKSFLKFINESTGVGKVNLEMICRSKRSPENFLEHRDLHNLAKGFYSNTTAICLRHINLDTVSSESNDCKPIKTLLVMESITTRRKWSIPDDDSSFLLRAQPVHLDVIGIHRDQRSHTLSYKKYAAYFDEPVLYSKTNEFRGGRLRRPCFLRYYPSDRTAAINFIKGNNCLDSKLGRLIHLETSGASKQIKEFERYLCNKSFREGSERSGSALTNSLLSNTVMDSNDFSKVPRPGKISDFVYRISLYEEPEVELSGKRFIVQDASCLGAHRADASSLEISDAALTVSLLLGQTYDKRNQVLYHITCDNYGVPLVHLKVPNPTVDTSSPLAVNIRAQVSHDLRPYRLSFVRAALLISTSRKEAQFQVRFITVILVQNPIFIES
jgi:hypothetical protein